ncbi:hypothetical protein [Pedobacter sp. Leaf132]|uniref:hypothetical protein n=1 Tax=Pedobacter sp. Leaf132 TaxID=2876557 RepID=UPI001E4B6AA4|nr:hypothetical protein [Pedobacter sp. Leaf132]
MKTEHSKLPRHLKKLPEQVSIVEEQWSSKQFVYKNHVRASKRGSELQKSINLLTERMFHRLVNKVKVLHQSLPIDEDRLCLEINLRKHPKDVEGLHCIQTKHLHLYLSCTINCDYVIEYTLFNCPFELEVLSLIDKMALSHCANRVVKDDYPSFFNRCLQVQPNRFISTIDFAAN